MNTEIFSQTPAIIIFIALCFALACFQLGVSVLTLLSSHAIGANKRFYKLLKLLSSYLLGSFMAAFIFVMLSIELIASLQLQDQLLTWQILAIISMIIGVGLVAFYYRSSKGTSLWVPRSFAKFLSSRTKKTSSTIEAFSLGILTIIAELPFSFVAYLLVGVMFASAAEVSQIYISVIFAVLVNLPLVFISAYITSGHKISTVQRWRETNKNFLKWSSGVCLALIGTYILTWQVGGLVS